jgi:GAF domain-containing protein
MEQHRQDVIQQLVETLGDSSPYIDHICGMVRQVFGTDSVTVSILDDHTQWFRYRSGIVTVPCTTRQVAFCSHTIQGDSVMEVPDARLDHRFCDNPLVTGCPGIRYYAGAPIIMDNGVVPGALCLIDNKPRPAMSLDQRGLLQDFATMVSRELDLAHLNHRLDTLSIVAYSEPEPV